MGLVHTDAGTVLDNRLTVNIDGSTETSSGLTFGGRLRIRSNDGDGALVNGARVYMKSGAVEVAVGNIYGAIDSMPGLYQSEAGLVGNGAGDVVTVGFDAYDSDADQHNGVEVIYSAGAFTGHLSYSDADLSGIAGADKRTAAYGAYTMNDWTVALGMQDSSDNADDLTVLTVGGKVGDYGVGFSAADNDGASKITLNGSATFGAIGVSAFVSDAEGATDTAYGVGMSYDLGGASLVGAVERNTDGTNYADMGVSFSF